MLPLRRKADKKFCKTRGEEQFKETDSRQQHASSLKTQEKGRKDTPGRSKVSSSFKKEENPRRNSRCTATSPEGQTKTSGSQ